MSTERPIPSRTWLVLTPILLAAVAHVAFNGWIGLDRDDSENLEATRVLAAARQWTDGFGGLYGPFSERNPSVLIQAPLYYRLTGLLAWPMMRLGVDAVAACRCAGRVLSFASFLGILGLAARLARFDGAGRLAAWVAVGLTAASPVIVPFTVTMRPDMLGVFLQLLGLTLTLQATREGTRRPTLGLSLAGLAFTAALCVKQHFVGGPLVAFLLVLDALRVERLRATSLLLAALPSIVLVSAYIAWEQHITGGMLAVACLRLPKALKGVAAGSWGYAAFVFWTTIKRALGLAILAAACLLAGRRALTLRRLDAVLIAFIAVDLGLMLKLTLDSAGAWYNYALAAAICGAVVLARAVERIVATPLDRPLPRLAAIACAGLAILALDARLVVRGVAFRREVAARNAVLEADPRFRGHSAGEVYFAGPLQHYNVRMGAVQLAHDEWLYGAFEAIGAAEPRAAWLEPALESGPIRLVVQPASAGSGHVAGVGPALSDIGYEPVGRVGDLDLWERREAPRHGVAFRGGR